MIEAVDLFCGAGGTSSGILKAADERLQRKINLTAVNHWQTAINTHTLNHPRVKHICEPVENIHPLDLVKSGHLHLLAASCECRFHSNARGGGPCNEQSRSQPWQLIRWATDIQVDNILMENVREFMNWGPLNKRTKRPLKSKKGAHFKAFINALLNLGYNVDFKVQVAADFGDPTSRPRLMLIASKFKPVKFPEPSHGPGRSQPWRVARECIDFSIVSKSIFKDGKARHCANTLKRIAAGLQKFGGVNAEPFLIILRGSTEGHFPASARSIDEPMPTVTTSGKHAYLVEPMIMTLDRPITNRSKVRGLDEPVPTITSARRVALVEPFIFAANHGEDTPPRGSIERRVKSLDEPLPTITTQNAFGLCEPILVQTDQQGGNGIYARPLSRPLGTIVTKQNTLLVEPFIVKYYSTAKGAEEPLDTVTTRDRFLLIEPKSGRTVAELDIRARLLQPHELAAAHSFPKHYKFTGNKGDQTKQIGNSVPVELACAHAEAALR
jgi:DNA (cytosine-5)-methyltransferase 1